MICQSCKKNKTPLHSYTGEWLCSNCYENLFPTEQTQFVITMENHTKFKIAENLYNKNWLLREKNNHSFTSAKADFEEAIRLTEETAQQNPFALASLGYYYEVERRDLPLSVRLNRAFFAYKAVLLNENPIKLGLVGDVTIGDGPTTALKNSVAKNLSGLLRHMKEVGMENLVSPVEIDAVKAKLIEYNHEVVDKGDKDLRVGENKVTEAINTIWNIKGKQVTQGTALFGLYKFSKDEADLFVSKILQSYTFNFFVGVSRGNENDIDMKKVENYNTLKTIINNVQIDENIVIFYINHRAKKGAKLSNRVHKILNKNIEARIRYMVQGMLINDYENRYAFNEDDILIACRKSLSEKDINEKVFKNMFGVNI